MSRFARTALLVCLAATIAAPQSTNDVHITPKARSSVGEARPRGAGKTMVVKVNGQDVSHKIIDGRYYVSVDELARVLKGSLSFGDDALLLNTSAVEVSRTDSGGRVKGTLTYYFNENYGDKPDSGAPVRLMRGHIEISPTALQFQEGSSYVVKDRGHIRNYQISKQTIADGNGNFELIDVPEGDYTVIIQSKHRGYPKRRVLHIRVKAGQTVDASVDFGKSDN